MTSPVLRFNHLTKSFHKRTVVDDLCFAIEPGAVFGFLGPNGAGKSTTIRMVLSLVKPDSGDVEVFGQPVSRYKTHALNRVGALIEGADFYENLSARTNLSMLARLEKIPQNSIEEVLEIVELSDRGDDRVKTYSHGMKQRLGIAQALLKNPELLILDEPTTGLDPKGMKSVRGLIRRLADEGMTIFLSSHLLHEVEQVCSSLAIINQGKLVVTGEIQDLMKTTSLFTTEIHATPLDKTERVLQTLENVDDITSDGSVIKVSAASDQLGAISAALVNAGVELTAMIPRSSLEDYFLSITGEEGTYVG